jgi:peptidoglycan-associated lipoprotein
MNREEMPMRRILLLSLSVAALSLAGCPSKPKNGECKTSDDCKDQQGYGKVCVQGRCQECGADTDCQAGFVCKENKCAPRPECSLDSDCGAGRACQDGRCTAAPQPKAECDSDAQCGSGRACQSGRCVAAAPKQDPVTACTGHSASEAASGEDNFVHFDFDKASIKAEDQAKLQKLAACLKQANVAGITVEGHCDQRGTADYNIQLGQRRAEAVRKYLANLGLSTSSIQATSYGKEKLLCEQDGDSCWARNRRAVISAAGSAPRS